MDIDLSKVQIMNLPEEIRERDLAISRGAYILSHLLADSLQTCDRPKPVAPKEMTLHELRGLRWLQDNVTIDTWMSAYITETLLRYPNIEVEYYDEQIAREVKVLNPEPAKDAAECKTVELDVVQLEGRTSFRRDLEHLINKHSLEGGSNTPDWILAQYLHRCLDNFDQTLVERERWYGRRITGNATSAPIDLEAQQKKDLAPLHENDPSVAHPPREVEDPIAVDLKKEIQRCRNLLSIYESMRSMPQANVRPITMMLTLSIKNAETALAGTLSVLRVNALNDLRGYSE